MNSKKWIVVSIILLYRSISHFQIIWIDVHNIVQNIFWETLITYMLDISLRLHHLTAFQMTTVFTFLTMYIITTTDLLMTYDTATSGICFTDTCTWKHLFPIIYFIIDIFINTNHQLYLYLSLFILIEVYALRFLRLELERCPSFFRVDVIFQRMLVVFTNEPLFLVFR